MLIFEGRPMRLLSSVRTGLGGLTGIRASFRVHVHDRRRTARVAVRSAACCRPPPESCARTDLVARGAPRQQNRYHFC